MPIVRFVDHAGALLAQVDASSGESLLDVARAHDIPLHWRCGQGTCGTCRLHIRHADQPRSILIGSKERNVLTRAGLLAPDAVGFVDQPDSWRLACHLTLTEEEWLVEVPLPA